MPDPAASTTENAPWYVRFQILWLVGCVLLVQSILASYRTMPANYWQRTELPASSQSAVWKTSTREWQTGIQAGYLLWPEASTQGTQSLTLALKPGARLRGNFLLQYNTTNTPYYDDDTIHSRTLRPARSQQTDNELQVTWLLPEAARELRLQLPAQSSGFILSVKLKGIEPDSVTWHFLRQSLQYSCFAILLSLLVFWAWKHLGWLHWHPHLCGLLFVAMHGLVMIFALPPFQGPDENRHWKTAMEFFRRDGQAGSILYRLPVILDSESLRLRSEVPFQASLLQAQPDETGRMAEQIKVTYVKHWGYPTIGLVSLIYPLVTTVQEAIGFYYTCRIVNLCCFLILLGYAYRLRLTSWTLFTICSLPLVMQQCVILSTDTVHNLGTLWALLLAARQYKQPSSTNWSLLMVVSIMVVLGKPPIYLITLMLPAWFLPWRQIIFSRWLVIGLFGAGILAVAGYWYLWRIVDGTGLKLGDAARQQLQFILTAEGAQRFAFAAMEYPNRVLHPKFWFSPIGWLDTILNPVHMYLLWISLVLAFLVDGYRVASWIYHAEGRQILRLVVSLGMTVLHGVFMWWSLALVMYLTITPLGEDGIVGMQVRYMIPTLLVLLVWPVVVARDWKLPVASRSVNVKRWVGLMLLCLSIIRSWQLVMDLIQRYWR